MTDLNDFVLLVRKMREAQQAYFRDRTYQSLALSKSLERQVDKAVRDIQDGQQDLFNRES